MKIIPGKLYLVTHDKGATQRMYVLSVSFTYITGRIGGGYKVSIKRPYSTFTFEEVT